MSNNSNKSRPSSQEQGSARSPMTPMDAARIQSSTARQNGGMTPADSFASRAQRAASHNSNNGKK
ncbi:hypothetical protein PPG32_11265 [Lautropia mirabilis]|jgi:hypothetical protein|uniref:hypothetical protein n=1 Tax=Lautropia mirabilis TaxID=47671 RepID=UPI001CAE1584|nr:hypothetical protein [Lautropia mirabilis]MBF1235402.1 hypothetical protein [Lautropia mirabilis]MDC6094678.1 hypothetical protein [Lautropia mirabilis]